MEEIHSDIIATGEGEIETPTQKEQRQRAEGIQVIREVIDFLEAHPRLPLPSLSPMYCWFYNKEELIEAVKELGDCKKVYQGNYFMAVKNFHGFELQVATPKETVCKQIVTKKIVQEQVPVTWELQDVEKEIVTWDCPDSLLAPEPEK